MIRVVVALLVVVLAGTIVLGIIGAVAGRLRLGAARRRLEGVLGSAPATRVDHAELVEVRSRGRGGGGAHGGLALTAAHLVFVPDLPAAPVLWIDLDAVDAVEAPRRHRHVLGWDRMLRVSYRDGDAPDQAVFRVDDARVWADEIGGAQPAA